MKATHKEAIAKIQTEYGNISIDESVISHLVQHLIREIPGVHEIQFRRLIGKNVNQAGKVSVSSGDTANAIQLHASVWLSGHCKVVEVATHVQSRLYHDIPIYLGIQVESVNIMIENLVFE